jgi:flagellar M-ring protein FliF
VAEANDILKQIKNVWTNLGSGQKVAAAGVTVLVFAAVLAAALLSGTPDYKQLISQVSPKDISGVIAQLEDAGITNYKIIAGNAIHVDSADYEVARSTLYRSGTLPGKGQGEEDSGMFSSGGGLSRDERTHSRNLKTEKRLEKSLKTLGYIENAKVTITGRKKTYFKRGKENAKAMVMVKTRGVLSRDQIQTIAYMVASGVESLSADLVAISNNLGMVLKKPSSGENSVGQESRLAFKSQLEMNKTMKAQTILDQVYGPNKVLVAVDVNLDWTRSNTIEKKFDSEGKIVREKLTTESTKPVGTSSSGGTVGNASLQGDAGKAKAALAKDTTKKETADFGFKESKMITLGGTITRMTASVFVDESLESVKNELLQIVSGAIGIDTTRGDKIELTTAKIEGTKEINLDEQMQSVETKETVLLYFEKGIYLVLGLAFVFFALRTIRKAQADLRLILEASLEEEEPEDVVAPLTLEQSVLETAIGDTDLAGRSLRRWLYEGAETSE